MSGLHSTSSNQAGGEGVREYAAHLLNSERFRKAPVLRTLLQYLLDKVADGRTEEIKESVIAVEVFERSLAFDSRSDNIVRVQAHRLRKLLDAYYEVEGAGDPYRVSIPKGGYVPLIERRAAVADARSDADPAAGGTEPTHAAEEPSAGPPPAAERPGAFSRVTFLALASTFALGAVTALAVAAWVGAPFGVARPDADDDLRRGPLVALWGPLLPRDAKVVVSFTNPAFLWTQSGGTPVYMTYRGPISAPTGTQIQIAPDDPYVDHDIVRSRGPFFFSDSWTGTGELYAAHRLTDLFARAGKRLKAVRSRSLTYDDLHEANVIFLGSTWANELQEKFDTGETPLVCYGRERIVNRHRGAGEPAQFEPVYDPKTSELVSSYVLFTVLPGLKPQTRIFASAGIQTYGTYAAIDYLTSPAGVTELLRRFDPAGRKQLPDYFQAVIRHEMLRGEPIKESLVLVRKLERGTSSTPAVSRLP
jgi:hypothetical protein